MDAAQSVALTEYIGYWRLLGSHALRIDEDIVWIRNHGVITGDDQRQLYAICNAMYERFGYILVLNDVRELTSVSPEARRLLNDGMRVRILPSHTAIYGAKPWIRAMAVLSQRAIHLFTGKTFPISFGADESEARAILAAHRLVLASTKGKPLAAESSAD